MTQDLKIHYRQPSYSVENETVQLHVTKTGAYLTALFNVEGKKIDPFYVAPWWNEERDYATFNSEGMRGTWFCFPFGLNKPFRGISYPVHGFSAENEYEIAACQETDTFCELRLKTELPEDHAQLSRRFLIRSGEHCIYTSDTVTGAEGRCPVGYHPTLRVPERLGSSFLSVGDYLTCRTSPLHIEDPAKGGYSSLLPDYEVTDLHRVPTIYGSTVDLTRQPYIKGFDDIYLFVSDPAGDFGYTALSVPEEGYLYFQLKDPGKLASTMVWSSYGGRHYAPWEGRVNGCIGLEEISAYYYYGITAVQGTNDLMEKGYKTYENFCGGTAEYRLIQGIVPIGPSFTYVKSMTRADESTLLITGENGEEIPVRCQVDFLSGRIR